MGKLGPKNNIIIIIREIVGKRKQALVLSQEIVSERVDTPTNNKERPVHTEFGCKTLKNKKEGKSRK